MGERGGDNERGRNREMIRSGKKDERTSENLQQFRMSTPTISLLGTCSYYANKVTSGTDCAFSVVRSGRPPVTH